MFYQNLLGRLRPRHKARRSRARTSPAAVAAALEMLESRRLLSTDTYQVPLWATSVQLKGDSIPGEINVYLNHDDITVYHQFTGVANTDVIDAGGLSITCQDFVSAYYKPQSQYGGSLQFVHGNDCTLELDGSANYDDHEIDVLSSDATSTTIQTAEGAGPIGSSNAAGQDVYFGAWSDSSGTGTGFAHLLIQTSDDDAPTGYKYDPQLDNDYGTTVNAKVLYGSGALTINTGLGTYDTIELGGGGTSATDPSTVTDAQVITGAGYDRVLVSDQTDAADLGLDQPSATVDFGAGGYTGDDHHFGLGNYLHFGCGGHVTIADLANDGHTVVMDQVGSQSSIGFYGDTLSDLVPPGTVTVATESAIQDLYVYGGNDLTLEGANTYVQTLRLRGTATVTAPVTIGTITPNNSYSTSDGPEKITFAAGSGSSTVGDVEPDGFGDLATPAVNVEVESGASVTAAGTLNSLTVAGTLTLGGPSAVSGTLEIDGGLLDLHGNSLLTSADNLVAIQGYLASGYDGGGATAWQGKTGITSSLMNGPAYEYGIGYAVGGHPNVIPSIPTGEMLLLPTMFGDTNLDGTTTNADISAMIAAGYYNKQGDTGGHTWADGDWNYDGYVNNADVSLLIASGNYNDGVIYPG